jgi:hypothetical protein
MNLTELVDWASRTFGQPSAGAPHLAPRQPRPQEPAWLPQAASLPDRANEPSGVGPSANEWDVLLGSANDRPAIEDDRRHTPLADVPAESLGDVHAAGADVLAFYRPFHFYPKGWGIYVRASGMAYLARVLKGAPLATSDTRMLRSAYEVLVEHEYGHFLCEAVAALGEVGHLRPWYVPYFSNPNAASIEEGFCNALALKRVGGRSLASVRARLGAWMAAQGDGYGKFASYTSTAGARRGRDQLARAMVPLSVREVEFLRGAARKEIDKLEDAARVHETEDRPASAQECRKQKLRYEEGVRRLDLCAKTFDSLRTVATSPDWPSEALWSSVGNARIRGEVPMYLVVDKPFPWLRFGRAFPKWKGTRVEVYTRDHDPAHIHVFMPADSERGKYKWPDLEPAAQDVEPLSTSERRKLVEYLERHGEPIRERLQRTYGRPIPDWR